jgi:hypothetical protein
VTVSHTGFELDLALLGWVAVSDQRSLLRGRLATAIDGVTDVAARLEPPTTRAVAPSSPSAPAAPSGRPWTVAAAMEPVAQAPIDRVAVGSLSRLHSRDVRPAGPPGHHRFPAIIGAVITLAVLAVIGVRLLPGSRPAPATPTAQIALTAVRPVAPAAPVGGLVPPTQVSFPAGTSTVSIDVNSSAATGHAPVEIRVGVGQPAQTLIDHEYVLDASGNTLIPLTPASGTYAPGDYTVTIMSNGATVGSTAFQVR